MKPSYEELEIQLEHLKAKLGHMEDMLKKALEEIAKLQEKLDRNSKNSSKPPSSDQKANISSDEPKKKRKGKKDRAKPLYPSERVDHHIDCCLDNCPHCGSIEIQWNGDSEMVHQAELPEVKAVVTEYELLKYRCLSCRKNSIASLPPGIPDSAFGPKLMGLLVTLTGVFHLAKREAIQLIKELYNIDITLEQRNRRLGQRKRRLESHLEDGFANGSDDLSGLCDRLLEDYDKLWTFTRTPGMEPTNNLAERDLRKLVIWRRKSYGTRSERGKKFVERITTVAQTLKKQSRSILAFIQEAISDFYTQKPTPFISE